MGGKLKWDISGKGVKPRQPGEAGGGYDGPDLPKGSWPAKIKRMEVTKIRSKGENMGKPRIRILLEVQASQLGGDKPKYHGAPVWDGLNIIESGKPYVNAFLHALTDGSEKAKRAIEAVFWDEDKGADFKKVRNKKTDEIETHITKIGRVQINSPEGTAMVQIVTRPGHDDKGNYRPEVAEYLPYTKGSNDVDDDDDSDIDDDDVDDDDDDVDDDDDDMLGSDDDDDVDDDDVDDDDDEDDDDTDEDDEDEDDEPEPVKATAGRRKKPPF